MSDELAAVGYLVDAAARHLAGEQHRSTIGPTRRSIDVGGVLGLLVDDVSRFADETWDAVPDCWKGRPLPTLFGSDDLEDLLDYGGLRLPEVRMVVRRQNLPPGDFARDVSLGNQVANGVIDATRVRTLLAKGPGDNYLGVDLGFLSV